jgi:hypothetical protein
MDRGLKAPLSPHEEVTLRRIALGIANPADLSVKDIERLGSLLLIEVFSGGLRPTPIGKQRCLALPNSAGFDTKGAGRRAGKDSRVPH